MRKLALIFGCLIALATQAMAQSFPQTLPPSTVYGRMGISAGPGQAIPFATLSVQLGTVQSIKNFGAKGDGTTNDTAAFTAAFTVGGAIIIPCGTYNVTTTTIALSATKVLGSGAGCATIRSTVAGQPVILVNQNLTDIQISGVTIDRTVAAVAGGTGIDYHNTGDRSLITDVIVQNQYYGIWLGPTGLATLRNARLQNNYNVGILMDDSWGAGGVQWWLDQILLQENDSHDIEVHAINGTLTLGNWTNIVTFASTGSCVYAHADVGTSVDSIRMVGGFLGSNNTHCIRLATRGGNHVFDSVHMELFGNTATGRTLVTAATHTGDCYNIDSTNTLVTISNPYCNQPWGNGVTTSATINQITGGTFQNARGTQGGIYSAVSGAKVLAVGVNASNNGGVLQQYGIFAAEGSDLNIRGGRFVGNAVAAYGATANPNSISYDNSDKIQSPASVGNVIGSNTGTFATPTCATMNVLLYYVSSTNCYGLASDATGNIFVAGGASGIITSLRLEPNATVAFPQYSRGVLYIANTSGELSTASLTGLQLDNGTSAPTAYAGTSCTNQFIRSLSAAGVATCASVANTDLTNSTITIGTTSTALGASSTSLAGLVTLTGGTGTTGTQLTFQTTTGNGTTDAFAFKGGNNGATTFATLSSSLLTLPISGGVSLTTANAGIRMSSEAGGVAQNIDTGSTGRYLRFLNTDGVAVFQAGNTNDATMYFDHTTHQFTNLANNANYAHFNSTGLVIDTTTDASSTSTGSIHSGGGMSINKRVWFNGLSTASAAQTAYACIASTGEVISVAVANNCATSSMRFKQDVVPLALGLETVMRLKPIAYHYRLTGNDHFDYAPNQRDRQLGFSAEQAASVSRDLVGVDEEGNPYTFRYDQYTAVLTRAMQELKDEIETLKRKVH